ncbi:hypothetical protein BH11MYX3_BH11MYX3_34290 [soil metagenome]
MRHVPVVSILLALLVSACTSFDSLDRNVCGNGVIENGEDCDSSDASCVRCAVSCSADGDCPTTSYACGTDGLCHAPGGTLAAPQSAGPFQVNDFTISDIDRDGAGDVVGLSRTSIVVRDGDPSGLLGSGVSLVTPFQNGRPAFGDLDGDSSLDVTMSTPDGLVTFTSPLGQLTPFPVQSRLGESNGQLELFGLYRVSFAALGAFLKTADDRVLVGVFDFASNNFDNFVLPCDLNIRASTFTELSYDVYRISKDEDTNSELLMSITASTTGGASKTCVMVIKKSPNGKASFTNVTPGTAVGLTGRAVLVDNDFDVDRCPGVMSAVSAGGFKYWDGTRSLGECTLAASPTNFVPTGITPGATLIGRFPLIPAISLAANDVIVFSDGIYVLTVVGVSKIYTSTRKIARSDYGDLNGDGRVDGVVASENEDDIDILYRTVNPGYQLVRLDTASRVSSLTIADYDGNGIDDIAYTELIDEYERLEVSFCTIDRPLEPIAVGAFPNNISIVRLQVADSVDQQGLAADLAVLTLGNGNRPPTVTLLHGSPQRTMLPYYDPTPDSTDFFDKRKPYVFRGAVIGQFANNDPLADVVGIGVPVIGHPNNASNPPINAWVMRGTVVGPDGTPSAGKPMSGLADCARGSSTNLCVDNTLYLPFPAAGHDVVIGIDSSDPPRAGVVDPASVNGTLVVTPNTAITSGVPAASVVRSAYATDLDGDGVAELLVSYAPRPGTPGRGAVKTCVVTGGVPGSCEDLVPAILDKVPGALACVDAAPSRIYYRDPFSPVTVGSDLVVLCRGNGLSMLERVRTTADGLAVEELSRVPELLEALHVGDVTGDGLDDVAAIANDHGAQTLEVFRQCSSRDASTCRGGQ